ncbi:isoprenylcysteine carboxylmethyltransferase family protein [Mesorhizobium sp. CA14]|uniref:methyltransferase family protein n=1 Tax=Mesorhizobium sp. CA14 TaxID=2876642 RepID=UPI001CCBDA26|nr:isoprenylcysteine carboxylmethyltransferase family protein [Mesorhizobium sp. CA14]MBZ9846803.1 isoprenylcysteine carboxylmethyltransferase family protein [Mesorhizobium sp. CA14]
MKLPSPEMRDFIGRATMTLYFTFWVTLKTLGLITAIQASGEWTGVRIIDVVAEIAAICFVSLMVITTVARLSPLKTAEGVEPRISALIGSFATVTLIAVPRAQIAPQLELVADSVTIFGFVLCISCLWWLGRSFSIVAQARRLVTTGPYRIVRHPLYVCETVVLLGIVLRNPKWATVTVCIVCLAFQYRRLINEEKVLRAAFPEYDEYARRVPMLLPRVYGAAAPVSGHF